MKESHLPVFSSLSTSIPNFRRDCIMFFAFLHIFASLRQCAGRRIAALHRQSGMLSSIVARATRFYKKGSCPLRAERRRWRSFEKIFAGTSVKIYTAGMPVIIFLHLTRGRLGILQGAGMIIPVTSSYRFERRTTNKMKKGIKTITAMLLAATLTTSAKA